MSNLPKELYGLVGKRLGHSFSRDYFNDKFTSEGIDAEYVNFELDTIDELPAMLASNTTLQGFNVTIPYKQDVMRFLDEIDSEAELIGAVNVVRVSRDGGKLHLKGFNSDVVGFTNSIRPLITSLHKRALVLGTGGASRAIVRGLSLLGIDVQLVSRASREGVITYDELTPEVMSSHTVIVNTTPLGMYPNIDACPPIPYDLLTTEHLCYDLVYNPEVTKFMCESESRGAITKNGLEMLLLQAFESWVMWNSR